MSLHRLDSKRLVDQSQTSGKLVIIVNNCSICNNFTAPINLWSWFSKIYSWLYQMHHSLGNSIILNSLNSKRLGDQSQTSCKLHDGLICNNFTAPTNLWSCFSKIDSWLHQMHHILKNFIILNRLDSKGLVDQSWISGELHGGSILHDIHEFMESFRKKMGRFYQLHHNLKNSLVQIVWVQKTWRPITNLNRNMKNEHK